MYNFRQLPVIEEGASIELTPSEFFTLMSYADMVGEIFNRNIENSKITIKYYDDEDNEISEEQVREMINQHNKPSLIIKP